MVGDGIRVSGVDSSIRLAPFVGPLDRCTHSLSDEVLEADVLDSSVGVEVLANGGGGEGRDDSGSHVGSGRVSKDVTILVDSCIDFGVLIDVKSGCVLNLFELLEANYLHFRIN